MQTQSPPVQAATTGMLHILQPPGQAGHRGEAKGKKTCFVPGFGSHQENMPCCQRLPGRDGAVGARRGHLSSSKREMLGQDRSRTAPAPGGDARRHRGCERAPGMSEGTGDVRGHGG